MRAPNFVTTILCLGLSWTAAADTIAVIGTGGVGSALGPHFAAAGHTVIYGSRTPDDLDVQTLVTLTGNGASATSQSAAAADADIVLLAIPWAPAQTIVKGLGNLDDKIIIDQINALAFGADKSIALAATPSAAQMIQDWAPRAHVVKAFNTLTRAYMVDAASAGGSITIPLTGNSAIAKDRVATLVSSIGLEPLDVGMLSNARAVEAMGQLYVAQGYQDQQRFEFHLRSR